MLLDNEQRAQWIKWMKSTPNPLFLDLTSHIRQLVVQNYYNNEAATGSSDEEEDRWITQEHLQSVDMTLEEYTSRIACHVILIPSGAETAPLSLVESTGAHVYGKLLYGGVTRFRLLKSGKTVRRAGENREVMMIPPSSSSKLNKSHPSWVQLGGIERRYEALDMGPAAVLEITLLPKLWQDLPTVFDKSTIMGDKRGDMTISDAAFGWDPSKMLKLLPEYQDSDDLSMQESGSSSEEGIFGTYEGEQRNVALRSHFQSRVGGLQSSIDAIVRRVLDGRSIYAQSIHSDGGSDAIKKAQSEAQELALLGITPVRGLLLYGRPGVGKTLIVREIARALGARPPKIVAASELLDRWLGGSERLVRELFQEAEEELKHWQTVARSDEKDIAHLKSSLHVIVIDEVDAVFRSRTDSEDSGAITRNSVVNQLLAKLDGVRALPNVLLIAMTNRRELLDPAILRPGRLEVQIEITMPNKEARREILQIHFSALRKRNRLSYPLRCAIDGVNAGNSLAEERTQSDGTQHTSSDKSTRNRMRKRDRLKTSAKKVIGQWGVSRNSSIDIADDKYTGGMSGADIAGLVRNAGSLALARARKDGSGVEGLLVTLEDVLSALDER
jgi:vesicle-fusing ATPase